MNAADQIKHKIQNDPIFKKHEINFVRLDGTIDRRICTGIFDDGQRIPGVLSWRDEKGVFHLSPINNFLEVYFDEVHRDMMEAAMDEAEKAREEHGAD